MFNKLFWKDATERIVSSASEAFLAYVGVGVLNVLTFNWKAAAAIAAGAAVTTLAKGLAANKFLPGTVSPASLVKE